MSIPFVYRVIKSFWGVYVALSAEVVVGTSRQDGDHEITPRLSLRYEGRMRLTEDDQRHLYQGLSLIAPRIEACYGTTPLIDSPLLVRVTELSYNECDYQPEGLTCAIAGWAAEAFGFALPEITVRFDRQQNRYEFDFAAFTTSNET
jgi:hypothetical protein